MSGGPAGILANQAVAGAGQHTPDGVASLNFCGAQDGSHTQVILESNPKTAPTHVPRRKAPTKSEREWVRLKPLITDLYRKECKTLSQVRRILSEQHQFHITWVSPDINFVCLSLVDLK